LLMSGQAGKAGKPGKLVIGGKGGKWRPLPPPMPPPMPPPKRPRFISPVRPLSFAQRPAAWVQPQEAAPRGFAAEVREKETLPEEDEPMLMREMEEPQESGDDQDPALNTKGRPTRPDAVDKGMVVIYDGKDRGWIDNVFSSLNEFWVCNAETKKVVYDISPEGDVSGVRAFTFDELEFTGEWSDQVESTESITVPSSLLRAILDTESWEEDWEARVGVVLQLEKMDDRSYAVVVGPGSPPQVKAGIRALADHFREETGKGTTVDFVLVPAEIVPAIMADEKWTSKWQDHLGGLRVQLEPSAVEALPGKLAVGPGARKSVEAAIEELCDDLDRLLDEHDANGFVKPGSAIRASWAAPAAKVEPDDETDAAPESPAFAEVKQELSEQSSKGASKGNPRKAPSTGGDTMETPAPKPADEALMATPAWKKGYEAAQKTMEERRRALEERKLAVEQRRAAAAMKKAATKEAAEITRKAEEALRAAEEAKQRAEEERKAAAEERKAAEDARKAAAAQASTAAQPAPSTDDGGKDAPMTIADWAKSQSQFADMPALEPGWIRVRSNKKADQIYYVNITTGQTQSKEPLASSAQGGSLPPGWEQMTSRSSGKVYYFHALSGNTTFQRPT